MASKHARTATDDLPLIVAHLLGGTSGLNLSQSMTNEEIFMMVSQAVRIAREIERQTQELKTALARST
jgi:hypothetical protein